MTPDLALDDLLRAWLASHDGCSCPLCVRTLALLDRLDRLARDSS